MADRPIHFLPERTGANNLGSPEEPWERLNTEKLVRSDGTELNVDDIATTMDVPGNSYHLLPVPEPIIDDGKILRSDNGSYFLTAYPKTLPPTTAGDAGKVLRINENGDPELAFAMTLPEVTASEEGNTLHVVAGEFQARRGNAHGDLNPTPIAPETDGMLLVSEGSQWVLKDAKDSYVMPPISPSDIGKLVTLYKDTEESPVEIRYMDPPLATETQSGAIPPLTGNQNHVLTGNLDWRLLTPGNNGHWRLGDIKRTIRPAKFPWVACNGAGVGSQPSGAVYNEDVHKGVYALLDGTPEWLDHWNDNVLLTLPAIAWCQIRLYPDAQAPTSFSPILSAEFAGGQNSFFEIQFSRSISDWSETTLHTNSNANGALGWWRLGGDYPALLNPLGDAMPSDGEDILFDVDEVLELPVGGLWHWRYRQVLGATWGDSGNTSLGWRYGNSVTMGAPE